jgi:membrane-associated phospholipid phosphatase
VTLSLLVFAGGLRGPAVAVTVAEDGVIRWLAGLRPPGLLPAMRALAALGSWTAVNVLLWGLLLALVIRRRLRHLLVMLLVWIVQGFLIAAVLAPILQRPRPFGVGFRTGWTAWALPSAQLAALSVTLLGILYTLVPEGRWRQAGKWAATAFVALVAIAHLYLGIEAPSDILVGVAVGVATGLLGFRWFAPSAVFPVTYRRGRTAHLDVGGARGVAIRQALHDQLGVQGRLVQQLTEVGGPAKPLPASGDGGRVPHDHHHAAPDPVGQPLRGEHRVGVVDQRAAPQHPPEQEAGGVPGHAGEVVGRAVAPQLRPDVVAQADGVVEGRQPAVVAAVMDVLIALVDGGAEHARRVPGRVLGVERLVDVGQLAAGLEEPADPAGAGTRHPGDDDR